MNKLAKKLLMVSISIVLMISMLGTVCFAANAIDVKVRIQGYNSGGTGEILDEYMVTLTDSTGFTALDALDAACNDHAIGYHESGGYVSAVDGQTDKDYPTLYWPGWMYRVWKFGEQPNSPDKDTLPDVGASQYVLRDGDAVTWYYALPEYTHYTIMRNYSSILSQYNEGASIKVDVQAQVFDNLWNWTLSEYKNLKGATVKIERVSDGVILASGMSDSNGSVSITAPIVSMDTDCYIYVDNKYYTRGDKDDGINHVKSWRKAITIINVN